MRVLIVLAAVADLAMGALFVAVSGFVLQGVNNTGTDVVTATLYVGFILACFACALTALLAKTLSPGVRLAIACAPLAIGAFVMGLEPVFV